MRYQVCHPGKAEQVRNRENRGRASRRPLAFALWIGFRCLLMLLGLIGEHSARGLFLVFVWLPSCSRRDRASLLPATP